MKLFWSKVEITDGCWKWLRCKGKDGYGRFHVYENDRRKQVLAHRLAYELVKGSIPSGLTIDHLCRNRFCVNPENLEAVSHRENTLRGNGKTAKQARQTECKRGHLFNESNTRIINGHRFCGACDARRHREKYRPVALAVAV